MCGRFTSLLTPELLKVIYEITNPVASEPHYYQSASKVDPDRRSIMTQLSTRYQMLTRTRWVK